MEIQRQIEQFAKAYDDAQYAPLLRWNSKFQTKAFEGMTPYICIDDICKYKYVVCAIPDAEVDEWINKAGALQEYSRRKVIVEYNSLKEMVKDGWRLDS